MNEHIKEQDEMTVGKEVWRKIAKAPCRFHGLLWDMVAAYMMDGIRMPDSIPEVTAKELDERVPRAYGFAEGSEEWIVEADELWVEFAGPAENTYWYFLNEIAPLLPAQEVEGASGTGEAESE